MDNKFRTVDYEKLEEGDLVCFYTVEKNGKRLFNDLPYRIVKIDGDLIYLWSFDLEDPSQLYYCISFRVSTKTLQGSIGPQTYNGELDYPNYKRCEGLKKVREFVKLIGNTPKSQAEFMIKVGECLKKGGL